MADREKLIELLCEANSKSVDAELFEDSSYAQQLEIEADYLIANGVAVQEWIPVTERLPDEYQRVLALLESKLTVVARMFDNCWIVAWNNKPLPGVTHWMPLPEPPKGD